MRQFVSAVEQALSNRNWYGAVALALTLPDVCARLEQPQADAMERYRRWWDRYVLPRYTVANGGDGNANFFDSADAYALRCAYVQDGGGGSSEARAREALAKCRFVAPPGSPATKEVERHSSAQHNGALELQVEAFCGEVCTGVMAWIADTAENAEVQKNMDALLTIETVERR